MTIVPYVLHLLPNSSFLFCIEDGAQDFRLGRKMLYRLSHTSSPLCFGILEMFPEPFSKAGLKL
jgi:hypothetical protein